MNCKFCGCTDERACQVPIVFDEHEPGGVVVWGGDPKKADGFMPCWWIEAEVCSNPACVTRAYEELRPPAVGIRGRYLYKTPEAGT